MHVEHHNLTTATNHAMKRKRRSPNHDRGVSENWSALVTSYSEVEGQVLLLCISQVRGS